MSIVFQQVGQRKAEFKKFTTIISTLCERFYKRQGFEVAVMGVGNIVNADGNLQFCYETPGVEGVCSISILSFCLPD
jgi:hypothetical protein